MAISTERAALVGAAGLLDTVQRNSLRLMARAIVPMHEVWGTTRGCGVVTCKCTPGQAHYADGRAHFHITSESPAAACPHVARRQNRSTDTGPILDQSSVRLHRSFLFFSSFFFFLFHSYPSLVFPGQNEPAIKKEKKKRKPALTKWRVSCEPITVKSHQGSNRRRIN